MLEFDWAAAEAVRRALGRERDPDISVNFDAGNALAPLQRAFGHVDVREYHGELVLPDVATAMILWPGYGPQLTNPEEDAAARTEFEALVSAEFAHNGKWRVRRHDAVFVAKVSETLMGLGEDLVFRSWRPEELAIARKLLERPFPGRDAAWAQLDHSRVRQAPRCVNHCRTLEIEVDAGVPTIIGDGRRPLPIEARFIDSDGIKIDILLFETNGILGLLEFVVYSEKQQRYPTPDELWLWDRTRGEEPPWQGSPPP